MKEYFYSFFLKILIKFECKKSWNSGSRKLEISLEEREDIVPKIKGYWVCSTTTPQIQFFFVFFEDFLIKFLNQIQRHVSRKYFTQIYKFKSNFSRCSLKKEEDKITSPQIKEVEISPNSHISLKLIF